MALHSIMVVDDNIDMLHVYGRVLAQEGFKVFTAATGNDCLEQIATACPDIFLLDVMLPDWNGIDLVREIKSRPECANSIFVLLSGLMTDSDMKIKGLNAGALDYLSRPIPNKELLAKVKSLVRVVDFQKSLVDVSNKFEVLSMTDSLTAIANRRCFDEILAQEYSRHFRSGGDLSLIMLDIDHFKLFNDHYGHVSGDDCLRKIGQVLASGVTRAADLPARYGGEEFACILPDTDQSGAVLIAEKIRQSILDLAIPHGWSNVAECISASLGVVTCRCNADNSATDIVTQADELLYRAKSLGRNRVEYKEMPQMPEQECANLVQMVWKSSFCSRNNLIDAQHQSLFRGANELLDAMLMARPKEVICSIITRLLEETTQHFSDEERILDVIGFPGLHQHAAEHAQLLIKGQGLVQEFSAGRRTVGDIFQYLVHEVVMQHFLHTDREYFSYMSDAASVASNTGGA
jgi:diguanylate cyclase (GGDEF)-like protein/hemerythrin-like metal-binding protein